ncbi:MAG: hypothetical protein A3G43_14475 [Ignavibacteria bacterium RIFCSPLOWO2_12_FULL_56_21]|nr:MAG: hypothetical protein A3G43_14475 [Ignavibacteria bacterium RIFCSPLOWO2_12_FULL_56_21]
MHHLRNVSLVIVVCVIVPQFSSAQWSPTGLAICDTSANPVSGGFMSPQICSDDNGGAYVCWMDRRNGQVDIYAQHVANDGTLLWQKNGIPIVDNVIAQRFPQMVSDGGGGAYIAWEDDQADYTYVFAQRINAEGQKLWQSNGIKAAETGGLFISLDRDSHNGLLLGWSTTYSVFVQRLDSMGNRVWADSGTQITNRLGTVYPGALRVKSDSHGGMFVCWSEGIDYEQMELYVQRVDSSGVIAFQADGLPLTNNGTQNSNIHLISDKAGNLIVQWGSAPPVPLDTGRTFIQRIDLQGVTTWGPTGIMLLETGGSGSGKRNTNDGHGGAFIGYKNHIQHVDSAGNFLWPGSGADFTPLKIHFNESEQILNGEDGIWNIWTQYTGDDDVYAQYINRDGIAKWGADGRNVCGVVSLQDWQRGTYTGNGTAIIVWMDTRDSRSAVYAAKLDTGGIVTSVGGDETQMPQSFQLEQNYPNPFNPSTIIRYSLSRGSFVSLKVLDILGRELRTLVNEEQSTGGHELQFNAEGLSSGMYFYRLRAGNQTLTKKMLLVQ